MYFILVRISASIMVGVSGNSFCVCLSRYEFFSMHPLFCDVTKNVNFSIMKCKKKKKKEREREMSVKISSRLLNTWRWKGRMQAGIKTDGGGTLSQALKFSRKDCCKQGFLGML